MKHIIMLIFIFSTFLYCEDSKKEEIDKHIKEQMKKEQKYAQEQKFYRSDEYDFKGAEVDDNSLKNIPKQPEYNDDFDMNSVYD